MATVHGSYRTVGNIDECIESELFKVNVPLILCGMVGVAPPRDGRYQSDLKVST
jgi:hypothetical protein